MLEIRKQFLQGLNEVSQKKLRINDFTKQFEGGDLVDLIEWGGSYGYIAGLEAKMYLDGPSISCYNPRLTLNGKEYLKYLENPLPEEPGTLKVELVGLDEVIKALTDKNEILDEIRFLKADQVSMMKEKLEKLRAEEKEPGIPWEAMITLFTTLTSLNPS